MQIIPTTSSRNDTQGDLRSVSRHLLLFGKGFQRKIADLKIGIVGLGGLGSLAVESFQKLQPGEIVAIDKDKVDYTNLNRLIGATPSDASEALPKTDLAARNITAYNSKQPYTLINGDFLDQIHQEVFKQCDIIIGCLDNNTVRQAVNRLCILHGITYIDLGVGVHMNSKTLERAGGQVIIIKPKAHFCLHCSGHFQFDPTDLVTSSERQRQQQQGYIRGANIDSPQVYALNMQVVSWGMWALMRYISGETLNFDGITIDAKQFTTRTWNFPKETNATCMTCGPGGDAMHGDTVALLVREQEEVAVETPSCQFEN